MMTLEKKRQRAAARRSAKNLADPRVQELLKYYAPKQDIPIERIAAHLGLTVEDAAKHIKRTRR